MSADSPIHSGADLFATLMELLSAPSLTVDTLEAHLRACPALLEPVAQALLSALADAQHAPGARAQVQTLARIIVRARTESVRVVLAEESLRARRGAAQAARKARIEAARREFHAWREAVPVGEAAPKPGEDLPSLSEVVTLIRSISATERPHVYGRDLRSAHSAGHGVPEYLFRGESGDFPATWSSMARLRSDSRVSTRVLEDFERISEWLVSGFAEKWGLAPEHALGFLQHYGYPTDLLDVTSDASVAVSFASRLRVGNIGAMCVVPTRELRARASLIDLRHHQLARRPRKQSAFAIRSPEFPNLKAPEAIEALGLRWIRFRMTAVDAARFAPEFELLDARSDEVAGLIWLMISDYGKFSDEAAALLASRIDPAPVLAIAQSDGTVAMVSEDDVSLGEPIGDEAFRRSHHEEWSNAFAAPEPIPLPPELEHAVSTGAIEAGAVVRILTMRAIARAREDAS